MTFTIAPIVEGYGDVAAVPVLLRRMVPELAIATPVRFARNQLTKPDRLSHYARIAAANIHDGGALLLLMDADDDCAATLGPQVQEQLSAEFPGRLVRVAFAVREFEAWIVGGHAVYDVADADVAGRLEDRIRTVHGTYKKTVDQPRLIARADLTLLEQRSRSFRHLLGVLSGLVAVAAGDSTG